MLSKASHFTKKSRAENHGVREQTKIAGVSVDLEEYYKNSKTANALGVHPEIFKGERVQFFKKQPDLFSVNLFQPSMKI